MIKKQKLTAIVLKKKKLKDKDLLIFFFTREKGKIKAIAKGVQKVTSRRISHIDTGNLLRILVSDKGDFFYLYETELISGFSSLKKSLEKTEILFEVLKFLDDNLAELQEEPEIFNLYLQYLKDLSESSVLLSSEGFKKTSRRILGVE